jgi:CRISPR-associated protein Csm3
MSSERKEIANQNLATNSLPLEYQEAIEDLENLAIALAILEDDALGGHGSRGYGKVKLSFRNLTFAITTTARFVEVLKTISGN